MATGSFSNLGDVKSYIKGGHGKLTIVSKKSGERRTYRLRQKQDTVTNCYFVDVLTGPSTQDDWSYLGYWVPGTSWQSNISHNKFHTHKASFDLFKWFLSQLAKDASVPLFSQAEVWHSGECGLCGRELTTPDSIARGIGPVCAERA